MNEHYEMAAQAFRRAAVSAFGMAKPQVRQPRVLQSTLELVRARRHAAKAWRKAARAVPFSPSSLVARARALLSGAGARALAARVDGREVAEETFADLRRWACAFIRHHVDAYAYLLAARAAIVRADLVARTLAEAGRAAFLERAADGAVDRGMGNVADEAKQLDILLRYGGRKAN